MASGVVWWRFFPHGQIFECRLSLNNLREQTSDAGKEKAVKAFFPKDSNIYKNPDPKIFAQWLEIKDSIDVMEIREEKTQAAVLAGVAQAAGALGDQARAIQLFRQAASIAKTLGDSKEKTEALKTSAKFFAQAGHYREACDLVRYTGPDDAVTILTTLIREYGLRH